MTPPWRRLPPGTIEYRSLTSPVPDSQGVAFSATGLPCFFCGKPLTDPSVHWAGHHGDHLYLHADCVLRLFVRLARDVHEIQKPSYYQRRRGGA